MTTSLPLYALPLPARSRSISDKPRNKKRKATSDVNALDGDLLPDSVDGNTEYSAVITPEERLQRRLAGQPLDEPPPPSPFPHAPAPDRSVATTPSDGTGKASAPGASSLRSQHLAAITTVLHKCLEAKDYKRASRALALILRSEDHGQPIDLRHGGLWGIGGEILLLTPIDGTSGSIHREGLKRAKLFYDKLALQHPWHRTWPNVTNAQDFKLAMFGIWVYVTTQESRKLSSYDIDTDLDGTESTDTVPQAKKWELAEAQRIAQEMDALLATVPFIDDLELTRFRAHVAIWTADLYETIDTLEADRESNNNMQELDLEQAWLGNQEPTLSPPAPTPATVGLPNQKAVNARNLANTLFAKVGSGRGNRGGDSDDEIMNELDT